MSKFRHPAVLQPQGEHESIGEFIRRVQAQKKCPYSIPPRQESESFGAFLVRMQACEEDEEDEED